jgi:hypothetical protein
MVQQNEDCYGTLLEPFHVSAIWSSSNTSVMSLNTGGWAQAETPGTATISAFWRAFIYTDGGSSGCESGLLHPFVETLCNVREREVRFNEATYWTDVRASFSEISGPAIAVLDVGTSERKNLICGGDTQSFYVKFSLPRFNKELEPGISFARPLSSNQFVVTKWEFDSETSTSANMIITVRRTGGGTGRTISVKVAGEYQDGTFYDGYAHIRLICPNP